MRTAIRGRPTELANPLIPPLGSLPIPAAYSSRDCNLAFPVQGRPAMHRVTVRSEIRSGVIGVSGNSRSGAIPEYLN